MLNRLGTTALLAITLGSCLPSSDSYGADAGRTANEKRIDNALAAGKSVLVIANVPFDFNSWQESSPSMFKAGTYRPAVTYWRNRATGGMMILGGQNPAGFYALAKASTLNTNYIYAVIEPGAYDLVGFAQKFSDTTRLDQLPISKTAINSPFGVIRYSLTTLPTIRSYSTWVPPKYQGENFDGQTLTRYYTEGHSEQQVSQDRKPAVYVDGTGLVASTTSGEPTLGWLVIKPGQMVILDDFGISYKTGDCNQVPKVWECAVTSLSLSVDTQASKPDVQASLRNMQYSQALIDRVDDARLAPGAFFENTPDKRADLEKSHNLNSQKASYVLFTVQAPDATGVESKQPQKNAGK